MLEPNKAVSQQVLEAMARSRRLSKRQHLLGALQERTSPFATAADVLAMPLVITLFLGATASSFWPALIGVVIVSYYQWRLTRLETRLDALSEWVDLAQREEGSTGRAEPGGRTTRGASRE